MEFFIDETKMPVCYLQGKKISTLESVKMIGHTLEKFRKFKTDQTFEKLFEQASEIYRKIRIFMMMSRNVEDQNKLKYYRVNSFEPLIDEFINDFEMRVAENERKMAKLSLLIEKKAESNELLEIFNHYHEILPSGIDASRFTQEYEYFKSCIDGTNLCDLIEKTQHSCPGVNTLLRVAATILSSNASAERSFSLLKRIVSGRRTTMGEARCSDLAVIDSNHEVCRSNEA